MRLVVNQRLGMWCPVCGESIILDEVTNANVALFGCAAQCPHPPCKQPMSKERHDELRAEMEDEDFSTEPLSNNKVDGMMEEKEER